MNTPEASPRPTTCPSLELLADLESGLLPADTSAQVLHHVSTCNDCQTKLKRAAGRANQDPAAFPETIDWTTDSEVQVLHTLVPAEPDPTRAAPPAATVPRSRLGQYRLMAILGQGGMGAVCLAYHLRLKKWVAVKILPTESAPKPSAIARFHREMEAIGQLEHPHLVRATDADEIDGVHFLVMELVDGADLNRLVRESGKLSVADACEAARQAALGLQYAHGRGMVHRDIKPSNLILSRDGVVKVLDMGLALLHGSRVAGGPLTGTGQVMGTLNFMAPEQWEASNKVDIRADVYSLGCTLYMLLTGHVPYGGVEYESALQKMAAHANAPIPTARVRRPEVSADLDVVLAKMMAKAPAGRYQTPQELAAALAPFAAGADLSAVAETIPPANFPTPPTDEPSAPSVTVQPLATTISQPAPAKPVRRWAATVVGIWLFGAAVSLAAMYLNRDRQPPLDPPPTNDGSDDAIARAVDARVFNPRVTNNLLDRAPKKLVWDNRKRNVAAAFNKDAGSLMVQAPEISLLSFGRTKATTYTLRVRIQQIDWDGGVGVFFGYRPAGAPEKSNFHAITTVSREMGPTFFSLQRVSGTVQPDPPGPPVATASRFVFDFVPFPQPMEYALEIDVGPKGLERVMWGKDGCPNVCLPHWNADFGTQDYAGEFGVFCRGTATISGAEFIPLN